MMDKEQKEVTICKDCEYAYINQEAIFSYLSICCEKCKIMAINYRNGNKTEKYSYEKQAAWNIKGECPHYIKRIGSIETKCSEGRIPLCDIGAKDVPANVKPWYKRLFRLK